MATKVNQVRYVNNMSASKMMTVNQINTVVKTRLAEIHVWKLEHVVAMHSVEWSTDMPSVHAHQAIMATQSSNANRVSYVQHTVCKKWVPSLFPYFVSFQP
jgi:predicted SprT family Zn-dependent metalloprotease